MVSANDDFRPLPPRREKHGSKKDHAVETASLSVNNEHPHKPQSFYNMQKEMNSRFERRKAFKEFTLNPQGYRQKSTDQKTQEPIQQKEKRKGKKWSGGLVVANTILWLFLIMVAGIFFMIFYKF